MRGDSTESELLVEGSSSATWSSLPYAIDFETLGRPTPEAPPEIRLDGSLLSCTVGNTEEDWDRLYPRSHVANPRSFHCEYSRDTCHEEYELCCLLLRTETRDPVIDLSSSFNSSTRHPTRHHYGLVFTLRDCLEDCYRRVGIFKERVPHSPLNPRDAPFLRSMWDDVTETQHLIIV